jgi:hypothetical protein
MIVTMAIATTMTMPPMLRWALARLPLRSDEKERIEREEFEEQGFVNNIERLLVAVDDSDNGKFASHLAGLLAGSRRIPSTVLQFASGARVRRQTGPSCWRRRAGNDCRECSKRRRDRERSGQLCGGIDRHYDPTAIRAGPASDYRRGKEGLRSFADWPRTSGGARRRSRRQDCGYRGGFRRSSRHCGGAGVSSPATGCIIRFQYPGADYRNRALAPGRRGRPSAGPGQPRPRHRIACCRPAAAILAHRGQRGSDPAGGRASGRAIRRPSSHRDPRACRARRVDPPPAEKRQPRFHRTGSKSSAGGHVILRPRSGGHSPAIRSVSLVGRELTNLGELHAVPINRTPLSSQARYTILAIIGRSDSRICIVVTSGRR